MLLLPLRYQHSASLLGFWWWGDRRDSNPLILVSQTSSASALDSANIVEEGGGIEPLQLKLYLGFQDRLPTIQRHLPFGGVREHRSRSVAAGVTLNLLVASQVLFQLSYDPT